MIDPPPTRRRPAADLPPTRGNVTKDPRKICDSRLANNKEKSRHHDGYFSKVLVCFLRYKKDCVVVLISSAKVLLFFDIHNSKMYV